MAEKTQVWFVRYVTQIGTQIAVLHDPDAYQLKERKRFDDTPLSGIIEKIRLDELTDFAKLMTLSLDELDVALHPVKKTSKPKRSGPAE
jgi:hypothetical protein